MNAKIIILYNDETKDEFKNYLFYEIKDNCLIIEFKKSISRIPLFNIKKLCFSKNEE